MEEKYNPMKSAEIATEHNYNMLDGVLNNQDPPCLLYTSPSPRD